MGSIIKLSSHSVPVLEIDSEATNVSNQSTARIQLCSVVILPAELNTCTGLNCPISDSVLLHKVVGSPPLQDRLEKSKVV